MLKVSFSSLLKILDDSIKNIPELVLIKACQTGKAVENDFINFIKNPKGEYEYIPQEQKQALYDYLKQFKSIQSQVEIGNEYFTGFIDLLTDKAIIDIKSSNETKVQQKWIYQLHFYKVLTNSDKELAVIIYNKKKKDWNILPVETNNDLIAVIKELTNAITKTQQFLGETK